MIQSKDELEYWYKKDDPWDYEHSLDDIKRRDILLSEIPQREYQNVLDIGCGHGFITRDLPGKNIVGIDLSEKAIKQAKKLGIRKNKKIQYIAGDLFDLNKIFPKQKFDLIIITGVLYPQYIGKSFNLSYYIIDQLLNEKGILVSVHIGEWFNAKFPYLTLNQLYYDYRTFTHDLQVYIK